MKNNANDLIPHACTTHSLLQQQASTPSYSRHPLKHNPSCRKWLQANEWEGGGGNSIYHRWCGPVDAWHAAQAGTEVTESLCGLLQ